MARYPESRRFQCPTCGAEPNTPCMTPKERPTKEVHSTRWRLFIRWLDEQAVVQEKKHAGEKT